MASEQTIDVEEQVMSFDGGNIPLRMASQIMQLDYQTVRIGLIKEVFPIGKAMKIGSSKKYTFYISPKMFYEFTGVLVTNDMIEKFKREQG